MDSEITKQAKPLSFTQMIQTDRIQSMVLSVLGNPKRAMRFTASITTAVSVNAALKECDPPSLISIAVMCLN